MKVWGLAALVVSTCQPPTEERSVLNDFWSLSPMGEAPLDATNAFVDDSMAATLGEQLFFDQRLSSNQSVSCATCHRPEHGFADDLVVSQGIQTTPRHTPSTLNLAWNRWFFWDGHADSAWSQALKPLESPIEQDFNRLGLAHLIAEDVTLRTPYETVFGPLPDLTDAERFPRNARPMADTSHPEHLAWSDMAETDQQLVNRIFSNAGKAIAAYEQTLVRTESPFDRFIASFKAGELDAIPNYGVSEYRGLQLFVGRANCILCHSGPTFSDLQFHNLGLTPTAWMDPTDRGRYDGIPVVENDPFNGVGLYSDDPEAGEIKVGFIALDAEKLGQFKTPTLRNVALTPPYMHGGQLPTLEDVIEFYNQANQEPTVGHRDELIVPLNLTDQEKADLVAFLESLTGDPF